MIRWIAPRDLAAMTGDHEAAGLPPPPETRDLARARHLTPEDVDPPLLRRIGRAIFHISGRRA